MVNIMQFDISIVESINKKVDARPSEARLLHEDATAGLVDIVHLDAIGHKTSTRHIKIAQNYLAWSNKPHHRPDPYALPVKPRIATITDYLDAAGHSRRHGDRRGNIVRARRDMGDRVNSPGLLGIRRLCYS